MKNAGMLIAFAGGAVAGAIIGILISPDKGSNIRDKIGHMVHDKGHSLKSKLKGYLEQHGVKVDCCELENFVDDLMAKDSDNE